MSRPGASAAASSAAGNLCDLGACITNPLANPDLFVNLRGPLATAVKKLFQGTSPARRLTLNGRSSHECSRRSSAADENASPNCLAQSKLSLSPRKGMLPRKLDERKLEKELKGKLIGGAEKVRCGNQQIVEYTIQCRVIVNRPQPINQSNYLKISLNKLTKSVARIKLPSAKWRFVVNGINKKTLCVIFHRIRDENGLQSVRFDRVVIFKHGKYFLYIDDKKVSLNGAPVTIKSAADVEILVDIMEMLTLTSDLVEITEDAY
ncbi:uncharacterized protein LOC111072373 isoform X1 [Drosophila obscura]|uniref:uncharacterized protein LOC111072373 isoform X1 n=1 Tax=Drosophila obscura TaxID=7282 RepID=UPI001BB2C1F2|nr:uncharacterized protein LOC111072373 isoform X1 [Drosophila obscura]